MKFEHFIYAQFNDVGYRLIKSKGVDDILFDEDLHYLCQLDSVAPVQTWLAKSRLVAITYIGNTYDEYVRRGRWNHTILLPIWDYFKLNPPQQFEPYFIKETDKPPKKLQPLEVKE